VLGRFILGKTALTKAPVACTPVFTTTAPVVTAASATASTEQPLHKQPKPTDHHHRCIASPDSLLMRGFRRNTGGAEAPWNQLYPAEK